MTCREALEFLDDYLDGKLPLGQNLAFNVHLGLCRACRDYLDSYRKTIAATKAVCTSTATQEKLPEELIQAILAAKRDEAPNN